MHRLIALIASILIPFNAIHMWWMHRKNRLTSRLALLSMLFLALQVALGALIVVFVLPGAFTTIDVANSFLLLIVLSAMTAVGWREHRQKTKQPSAEKLQTDADRAKRFRLPVFFALGTIFLQSLVGGYFRHSGNSQALFGQHSYLLSHHQRQVPSEFEALFWLVVHISVTAAVFASVVWLLTVAMRFGQYRAGAFGLLWLVIYQIILGFVTLQTKLSVISDTLHFAGANAMVGVAGYLVAQVLLDLSAVRIEAREKTRRKMVPAHS
ncbi:COX15/CtaA family protein [Ferroacidibacillus organovorans]|nr:COX15/CtaA family protein [Ferroacidibacillus organovorans]OAG93228.1 hypothetical protein AYW79_11630 [Ferroacidibacillus organovorans]